MRLYINEVDEKVSAYHLGHDPQQLVDLLDVTTPQSWITTGNASTSNEQRDPSTSVSVSHDIGEKIDLEWVKQWATEMQDRADEFAYQMEQRWVAGNASHFREQRMESFNEREWCKPVAAWI